MFDYVGQSFKGRFDGENSGLRLVNSQAKLYASLVGMFARVNHKLPALHRAPVANKRFGKSPPPSSPTSTDKNYALFALLALPLDDTDHTSTF